MISVAAYELHIQATADATVRGHPGFVPDEYLDSLGTETTIAVADLITAGMWERVNVGGYRIRDWDAIRVTLEHLQMLKDRKERTARARARAEQARTRAEQEAVLRRLRPDQGEQQYE